MKSLRQGLGRQPHRNPSYSQIAKRFIKKQESGSEAKPDSANVALNRLLHTPSTRLGYALRGLGLRACDAGGGTRSAGA